MKKIELIAMLTDSKKIIELLQKRGLIELEKVMGDGLIKIDTADCIARFEQNRSKAVQALKTLNEKTQYRTKLTSQFSGRRECDTESFFDNTQLLDSTLRICEDISASARIIDECRTEISRLELNVDELKVWNRLDIPLDFKGTAMTSCFIGTVNGLKNSDKIKTETGNSAYTEIISQSGEMTKIVVICLKSDKEAMENILKQHSFSDYDGAVRGKVEDIIFKSMAELEALKAKISEHESYIASFSNERENIEFVIDLLGVRCDKYRALNDLAMTKNTFMLTGYIPEKYMSGLISEIESKYKAAITVSDPSDTDDIPIMLENSPFSSPVESVTEMYSLPGKHDIDPTGVMSFFYYLFFGMMLSDAGYGAVMVVISYLAIKKLKPDRKMKNTLQMFMYSGISTVFWGALFGSWFGDLPQTVAKQFFGREIGSLALWFEPLEDPIKLLVFSFGLGIAHLFWGLAVHFGILWKSGRKRDAVFDVLPIYMTVSGVAPLAAGILINVPSGLKSMGKYVAVIGAVFLVLTAGRNTKSILGRLAGGLYGLYNIATGYLSDILSYSRLLALGLATGSIASVINLIGTMPENIALKSVMFIVVFAIGHTANIAINLLGAYVHTNRLQFVELFSKFYEGGGRRFDPLKISTKYIKLKEENE